jgi:hypothetical protein
MIKLRNRTEEKTPNKLFYRDSLHRERSEELINKIKIAGEISVKASIQE